MFLLNNFPCRAGVVDFLLRKMADWMLRLVRGITFLFCVCDAILNALVLRENFGIEVFSHSDFLLFIAYCYSCFFKLGALQYFSFKYCSGSSYRLFLFTEILPKCIVFIHFHDKPIVKSFQIAVFLLLVEFFPRQ